MSDEADAHRYLAQRFNTGFTCRRCDAHWEEKFHHCPVCTYSAEEAEQYVIMQAVQRAKAIAREAEQEKWRLHYEKHIKGRR